MIIPRDRVPAKEDPLLPSQRSPHPPLAAVFLSSIAGLEMLTSCTKLFTLAKLRCRSPVPAGAIPLIDSLKAPTWDHGTAFIWLTAEGAVGITCAVCPSWGPSCRRSVLVASVRVSSAMVTAKRCWAPDHLDTVDAGRPYRPMSMS